MKTFQLCPTYHPPIFLINKEEVGPNHQVPLNPHTPNVAKSPLWLACHVADAKQNAMAVAQSAHNVRHETVHANMT